MRQSFILFLVLFLMNLVSCPELGAKKIKNSFRIDKNVGSSHRNIVEIEGEEMILADSLINLNPEYQKVLHELKECYFSGFDKEANSNIESFLLVNNSSKTITGFEVKIDYLDMKDRMFHSRTIRESCDIPAGESRKIDINGWDKQHTYYYYLGNQPRRVATPFKVAFTPLSYWIQD